MHHPIGASHFFLFVIDFNFASREIPIKIFWVTGCIGCVIKNEYIGTLYR